MTRSHLIKQTFFQVNLQINHLKELLASKESELKLHIETNSELKEKNTNLNNQIVKLNNLVQIGKNSFQEENKKVQDLETKLSLLNGKDNSTLPTANGN